MADLLTDLKNYMQSRTATNPICVNMGATLVFNKHFFIGREPANLVGSTCITIYPTGGYSPSRERYTTHPTAQVRIRAKNFKKGYDVGNAILYDWHRNSQILASTNAVCFAINADANYIGPHEDGISSIFTMNFYFLSVRYDKIDK